MDVLYWWCVIVLLDPHKTFLYYVSQEEEEEREYLFLAGKLRSRNDGPPAVFCIQWRDYSRSLGEIPRRRFKAWKVLDISAK